MFGTTHTITYPAGEAAGFHISFNPMTDCGAETALVVYETAKYYIVLGNHADRYKDCHTVAEAKAVFDKLVAEGIEVSKWSSN